MRSHQFLRCLESERIPNRSTIYEDTMQQEVALGAITHGAIGILILTLLAVLLIALRKEHERGAPLRGTVHLGFVLVGLCAFMTLMAGYFQARNRIIPQINSQRLDTAAGSAFHGAIRTGS
jgi:hypothetical protein